MKLFVSWLRERPAKVAVSGKYSEDKVVSNMVFQGTVWAPVLWSVFYEDSAKPVKDAGFTEVVFADDLNAFKEYDAAADNAEALAEARTCQTKLHTWGKANQVSFESTKESFHVISH